MYPEKFNFNSHSYNLWEIYEGIKSFYPIGIPQGDGVGIFYEYSGLKKLEDIIIDNIHDENNFQNRWTDYTDELKKIMKKEIIGTTYGQAPCFSSSIIIEKNVVGTCTHLKELHFAKSFVGNFFTIYGLDSTRILDEKDGNKGYHIANVVTGSPFKEFEKDFLLLENNIRNRYPNHKMIPYSFGRQIIDGLQVRYSDAEICSIQMALFNDMIQPKNNFRFTQGHVVDNTRGDIYYGLDDWKR
ncbi:hypothetical protein FGM00_01485 [Aggregatimonas sangjinii]|uniref:Uncharacterized protein n=1 Tax=Aggregatimonas sangjinii TaxID=2583587 RepID=A0A5B7SK44_9FLAO|nr:hypothetical protein [Aggregatimonas sangjinii]QCW98854.1 hypothetical protein FGM00_01485 [Aggregatimonas sangjinii]